MTILYIIYYYPNVTMLHSGICYPKSASLSSSIDRSYYIIIEIHENYEIHIKTLNSGAVLIDLNGMQQSLKSWLGTRHSYSQAKRVGHERIYRTE